MWVNFAHAFGFLAVLMLVDWRKCKRKCSEAKNEATLELMSNKYDM